MAFAEQGKATMSVKGPTIYPGVDIIRRIQELVIVCSLLPPDGKLREVLELALSLHEEPVLSRIKPIEDLHPHAVKAWLEAIWSPEGITPEAKELVDWQIDSDNMAAAIQELTNIERQIGVKLTAEKA
ncbi:DurN family substrate-assisted peptide maturase [Actinoallomurus sp. CA-150999]|uniref:DurN family substrate-assisted peptide maturase n=1 Tax=Actinoallomurus sp. CA-150999 TaxID=3239887 RepID=UPI003D8F51AD